MSTWLVFFLVCFAGIGFMFYCMMRRQDALLKAMRSEHAEFRVLLKALGARLELKEDELRTDSQSAPISVDEALDAYARKERLDMEPRSGSGKGMPDLKF